MKINILKKKIILTSIISLVLILTILGEALYFSGDKKSHDSQIEQINNLTIQAKQKSEEYKSKSEETKKYKEIWKNIPDSKKSMEGFKIDEVNNLLSKLSEKYYIKNQSIKISLPENLKGGIFDRKSINVIYSTVNISFNCLDDEKAIYFLSDFLSQLIGYVVVTNLDIKRSSKYNEADLVDISTGKSSGFIAVKLSFTWYAYKLKEEPKPEDQKVNSKNNSQKPSTNNNQPALPLTPSNNIANTATKAL